MTADTWTTALGWIGDGLSALLSPGGYWAVGSTLAVLILTKLLYGSR